MSQIATVFKSLEGNWAFKRIISGHGTIEGIATFKKKLHQNNALFYREEGVFTGNHRNTFQTFRDYIYRYDSQKNNISVYFAEQPERLFHILEFSAQNEETSILAKALHHCAADIYDATYKFNFSNQFTLAYSVKGPKKNYTIETVFKSYYP